MKIPGISLLSLLCSSSALLAELPFESRALIESVATPLGTTPTEAHQHRADAATMLRMEIAYQRLEKISFADSPMAGAARSASLALADCHWSMQKLSQLENNAPDFEKLAGQTLLAAPGLYKNYKKQELTSTDQNSVNKLVASAAEEAVSYFVNEWKASEERDRYQGLYRKVRELGMSPDFFTSIEKPAVLPVREDAIALQIDGSWDSTFNCDRVAFTNTSGKTLENVVMRVVIKGYHGAGAHLPEAKVNTEVHLHYVGSWAPGEKRYAEYAAKNGSGIVDDESLDIIDAIQVSLVSDQLSSSEEEQYLGPEFDADVKAYFEGADAQFRGGWSPFVEGLIIDDDAYLALSAESKYNKLPIASARARLLKNGSLVKSVNLNVGGSLKNGHILNRSVWNMSELNHLEKSDVDSLELTLVFSRSGYEYTLTWEY